MESYPKTIEVDETVAATGIERPSRRKGSAGFSLIEVVIALVIIMIA